MLAARTARPHTCCQTPCCPTISGIGFTDQKIPVLYKFRPPKISVNPGPSGKSLFHLHSVLYLPSLFYPQLYIYCMYCFLHTVFCTLYGYSATLTARLLNKLELTWMQRMNEWMKKWKLRRISFKTMFLLLLLTNKDSYSTQIIQCVNDTIFRKRFRVPAVLEPVLEL